VASVVVTAWDVDEAMAASEEVIPAVSSATVGVRVVLPAVERGELVVASAVVGGSAAVEIRGSVVGLSVVTLVERVVEGSAVVVVVAVDSTCSVVVASVVVAA